MYDDNSKGISYTAGFFMLICFAVAGAILASVIYTPIWTSMTGKTMKALSDGAIDPSDTNAIRLVQSISAIIGFFLPAILTAAVLHRRPMQLLGFAPRIRLPQLLLVILIMILALLVSTGFAYLNRQIPIPEAWRTFFEKMELDYNRMVEAIVRLNNSFDFVVALIVMAVIPAICEETLFRGGLQNFLTRSTRNPWFSIIIVSLIFSLVHLSFYGFLTRLVLGMVLGLIYHYSGKLWLSIFAHFLNNAIALTLLYVYKNMGKSIDQSISDTDGSWWGLLILPALIVTIKYFRRASSSSIQHS